MTKEKFKHILRFIRFDKRTERSRRLQSNKYALVSNIWDKLIENSQACYQPGQNITVDYLRAIISVKNQMQVYTVYA